MPLYEFECPDGHVSEELQKPDDAPPKCECGKETKKRISLSNFELKGSGWYKDGYQK